MYLANGDGPYSIVATSDKSPIVIPVQNNNSYKLYVLATDNVGNHEKSPSKIHDITVDIEEELNNVIPTEYSLEQNYPNPFNPETNIGYKIPKESLFQLKIYDILGREIGTLVNKNQKPGTYNYQFSISNLRLTSGVYFYQLKAGDFIQTKKMLLIK